MALLPMMLVALLDGAATTMPRDRGCVRIRMCAVPPIVKVSMPARVRTVFAPPYLRIT